MFSSKNTHYLLIAGLVIVASYVGMYSKQAFSATNNEYDMIKKYLLNDSPLYGFNKTKLWIHSKYEYNARHWESFQFEAFSAKRFAKNILARVKVGVCR